MCTADLHTLLKCLYVHDILCECIIACRVIPSQQQVECFNGHVRFSEIESTCDVPSIVDVRM